MYRALILSVMLLTACASVDVSKQIETIDNRPLLADTIETPTVAKIELATLEKFTPDQNGVCIAKDSLLAVDSQRRVDRQTIGDLNTALQHSVYAQESITRALKASELELKATERMLVRVEAEKERIQREKQISDITNKIIQLGLLIVAILP